MEKQIVNKVVEELLQSIENEDFLGYDPYDFYLSPIAKYLPGSILFLHASKISPINIRPLLRIKKGMVTKVYALMIDSYLNLYEITREETYKKRAVDLYQRLMQVPVVNTKEELGWGRNYPFKTGGEIHDNKKPLVYLDARIGQALIHIYDITKDELVLNDVKRIVVNIVRTGRILEKDGYKFIGYSSDPNTRLTFNVSIVAVETIMKYMNRAKLDTFVVDGWDMKNICDDIIRTMIHYQSEDGSWAYGYSAKGMLFDQKDFHQGFIIDSLYEIMPLLKDEVLEGEVYAVYRKGYDYICNVQIDKDGAFYWRYPQKYPIDIHNQAQGIISLSINKNDNNQKRLNVLLNYTITNFWDYKKHCFYYQKWPLFVNKISYSRWCNAWMLYAMTLYLRNK